MSGHHHRALVQQHASPDAVQHVYSLVLNRCGTGLGGEAALAGCLPGRPPAEGEEHAPHQACSLWWILHGSRIPPGRPGRKWARGQEAQS